MSPELITAFVPLAQTILWVALIGFVLRRYQNPVEQLIEIIKKRVESGSSVKAGPLELGEQIRPQDEQSQKQEVQQEAEEYVSGQGRSTKELSSDEQASIRSRIVLAEDLALRAIQDEYNEPLKRNISFIGGFNADAIFRINEMQYLVEVKVVSGRSARNIARKGIRQLQHSMSQIDARQAYGILCLVYLDEGRVRADDAALDDLIHDVPSIQINIWSLDELMKKYGIS